MTTTGNSVPFAVDGSSLSPVNDAVASSGSLPAAELAVLAFAFALVLVGVGSVLARVQRADERIEHELVELRAERDAFHEFADAVGNLRVGRATAMTTPQTVHAVDDRGPPVAEIEDAFAATVMAVDHYEETYDEPWLAHLAGELDDELAVRLSRGGTVNAPLKRALRQHALEAARKRDRLVDVLTDERESLTESAETIERVDRRLESMDDRPLTERSFDELSATYDRLGTFLDTLDELAARRQRQIRRETRTGTVCDGSMHLQSYLYGEPPERYPVLSSVAALTGRIETARDRALAALTATV